MKNNDKVDPNLDLIEIGASEDSDSPVYDQDVSNAQNNLSFEGLRVELQEKINQALRDNSIHKWRKFGLGALFILIVFWLLVICAFLIASGYDPRGFPKVKLSDQVLMTLIGTTTLNVFMLFKVAAGWLYGNQKSDKKGSY